MTSPSSAAERTEALRAQLGELYGLRCIPAWGTPRDLSRKTYGPKVAKVAELLGTPFMPWQRYVIDVALEVDPATGLLAYREVIVMVPRQSGKTTLVLARKIWRSLAWPRQSLVYAAQSRIAARKKWEKEHVEAIEACPACTGKFTVYKGMGNEHIRWRNGSWWGITSNTETASHGDTLDDADIDEAFSQVDNRLEAAFGPAMITRGNAQKWVESTAGTPRSVYLNGKRETGRKIVESGEQSTTAFFDWTVVPNPNLPKPGYDRTDPALWWSCMPALGYTVSEAAVRAELTSMENDPSEFDRAYLNITRTDEVEDDPNVPTDVWPALAERHSQMGDDVAIAIDVTPSRDYTSIGVCGLREDGKSHVELIDRRPGTSWVVERVLELKERWKPVAFGLDVAGPAGSLLVQLELPVEEGGAGLSKPSDPSKPERGQLAIPSARDAAAACGALVDACRNDQLVHIDQTELNTALDGARTRPLGDAWAWARKTSSADISPLVAITLARWAYMTRAHLVASGTPAPASAPVDAPGGSSERNLWRPRSRLDL